MNRRFDIYALGVTSALMSMARTTPAQERKAAPGCCRGERPANSAV
jgi:hypothetical protein